MRIPGIACASRHLESSDIREARANSENATHSRDLYYVHTARKLRGPRDRPRVANVER